MKTMSELFRISLDLENRLNEVISYIRIEAKFHWLVPVT